jgi:hypothetical protein
MKKLSQTTSRIFLILLISLLAGCAGVVKLEGNQTINGKMTVKLDDAWNKINLPGSKQPFDQWTQEGLTLDQLRLWAAIPSGHSLVTIPATTREAGNAAPRLPTFKAGMPADQLVNLFEIMYSSDGSIVTTTKVEQSSFAGEKGVKFEFTVLRKSDDVQLRGVAWIVVRNDQLYAASFVAPKLSFFPRLLPKAHNVINTALITG